MKILHISTLDSGGAANACLRIHHSLGLVGLESKVLVLHKTRENQEIYSFSAFIKKNRFNHFKRRFRKASRTSILKKFYKNYPRLGYFSLLESYYDVLDHPLFGWADVINLHWIGDFIDYPTFFSRLKKPIVWTCHDMNPMTGGCHYYGTCTNFKNDCNNCPLVSKNFQFLVQQNYLRKGLLLAKAPALTFVANSSWVNNALAQSSITKKFTSETIHYPIFLEDYFVERKGQARRELKLEEKKIVLFVAQNIGAKNKGLKYLLDAIKILNKINNNVTLLAIGKGSKSDFEGLKNYIHYDYIESTSKLRTFYNASDLFVIPSIDEAFGQTCLEAMACGLPVVGFNSGGIPDMISHGENGWLVPHGDVQKLAEAIEQILSNKVIAKSMGDKSLEIVKAGYSPERQAKKYAQVYKKVLSFSDSISQ